MEKKSRVTRWKRVNESRDREVEAGEGVEAEQSVPREERWIESYRMNSCTNCLLNSCPSTRTLLASHPRTKLRIKNKQKQNYITDNYREHTCGHHIYEKHTLENEQTTHKPRAPKEPSASEQFLKQWLKTGRGTSRATSRVDRIKAAIEGLDDSELHEIQQHAITLRRSRGFRFLDLAPEVRNMIYRLCIQPEDIETHVTADWIPALARLQVNREITCDFSSLYYSSEFMDVHIHDHEEEMVVKVEDPLVFKCLLARWPWCPRRS